MITARERYPGAALTISELAERTRVPQATLRSWESRYGFPRPDRLPGGHRRYAESDVAAVEEVLRHRAAGLGLEAAVRRVVSGPVTGNASLYGELRRRHPGLVPQLLSKRSMVALSHALEDECCAQAQRPLLFAGFQRRTFLRQSYARWVELARTAGQAVVFADLEDPAPARPGALVEVAVPYDAAINREWFLVCDAPDRPACLVGWERPGQPAKPDSARRFEAVWSADPVVVRAAARVCAELADTYRPGWRLQEWPALDETPAPGSADLQRASGLVSRMMGYLDAVR